MQQVEKPSAQSGVERQRVKAVVETLAGLQGRGESLAEVAHDARNMVTALGLYCDLLEEPGVLAPPFHHYGGELRLVATASRRLVEKLVALDEAPLGESDNAYPGGPAAESLHSGSGWGIGRALTRRTESGTSELGLLPAAPIESLVAEVEANRNLLAALAGPSINVELLSDGGALPVRLTGEDLTRVLVNLVKNAAESMPSGGRIAIGLHEFHANVPVGPWVILTIEDSGPGIPPALLETIFEPGFSTRTAGKAANSGWASAHRGLGLSICRSIVEDAGGRIHAANRLPSGARFEIELPARGR